MLFIVLQVDFIQDHINIDICDFDFEFFYGLATESLEIFYTFVDDLEAIQIRLSQTIEPEEHHDCDPMMERLITLYRDEEYDVPEEIVQDGKPERIIQISDLVDEVRRASKTGQLKKKAMSPSTEKCPQGVQNGLQRDGQRDGQRDEITSPDGNFIILSFMSYIGPLFQLNKVGHVHNSNSMKCVLIFLIGRAIMIFRSIFMLVFVSFTSN